MENYRRYAVFYAPDRASDLAQRAASWLGWDVHAGGAAAQPVIDGLDLAEATATPRKYGFHGTLKPPFRLAEGTDAAGLSAGLEAFAAQTAPVRLDGIEVSALGRFVALTPTGDTAALSTLAGAVVAGFEPFRAPLTEAEIAKRNPDKLSARQRASLDRWGYPHVFEDFRFHLTLSGPRTPDQISPLVAAARAHFGTVIDGPLTLDALTLFGERPDGMFEVVHRYPLTGSRAASAAATA